MMVELNEKSVVAGEIMTPYVIMLDTGSTFQEAIEKLAKNNISAVFIEDKSKEEYYIITKTDVINFLNSGGLFEQDLSNILVKEIMNGPVSMLDSDTPIDTINRYMTEHNYKRVLISKENKPAGVLSSRDIMMWNNTYFKQAKPQILLFMDNTNSIFIAKHIYEENIEDDVQQELIEMYGGALSSISAMTDEIIKKSGGMRQLLKDKRSILFEPYKGITGILVSDNNSIELRRKLKVATEKFYQLHSGVFDASHEKSKGINMELNIEPVVPIFDEEESNLK